MQGISGTNMKGAAALQPMTPDAHASEPMATSGGEGGLLNAQKDSKESAAGEKFGDLWKQIQTQYGAKPDKPREIKKQLGKDDFLRIMITQMKNQDPTNPFKAEEMATQMAQFASVEQLQNMNMSMTKMANANQPLERLAMTGLIGKTITIDRERFTHQSDNETSSLGYSLERPSKSTKLKIMSEQGETILEKDLGPQKAGDNTFVWDGAKTNGMNTKPGNFIFRVEAVDDGGRAIAMQTKGQAKVVGVAFDGPEGVLLVGNPNSPQKITMRNVIRIDSAGSEAPAIPGARSMASALQAQGVAPGAGGESAARPDEAAAGEPSPQGVVPQKGGLNGNWISYEKGVGSKNLDPSTANSEARKALEAYEAAKTSVGKNPTTEKNEKSAEKGFPSGFSSGDNNQG
jgi:flagellar basal-body rod modification protein FlgD